MQLPARFAKYELQEFLGGGMSHVYRALDTVIGRQVAVKILTDEACRDAEAKERFLHEARMSGTIQHDHIVTTDASAPLIGMVGSDDKEEVVLKGGHVSLIAGPNAVRRLWPKIDQWLGEKSV